MDELSILDLSQLPTPKKHTRWGRWHLVKRINVLEYRKPCAGGHVRMYQLDLDAMETSALCLDSIFQAAFKVWMTDKDRSDLLKAIRERIDPQANLCSFGLERGTHAARIERLERLLGPALDGRARLVAQEA